MRKRARADRDPGRARGARALVGGRRARPSPSVSRQPRRRSWKPVAAVAVVLVAVAGLLSPPGRAVLDEIREVVGVEESAAGAVLAARTRSPARHRRLGRLGRRRGRLEAAARKLSRSVLVAVRPLRRRVAAERARRADAGRRGAVDARAAGRSLPALGRHADGHPHRLPLGRHAAGRRRGRQGRPAARLASPAIRAPLWRPGSSSSCSSTRAATAPSACRRRHGRATRAHGADDVPESGRPAARARLLGAGNFAPPVRSPDGRWLAVGWPEADQLVFVRVAGGRRSAPSRTCRASSARARFLRSAAGAARPDRRRAPGGSRRAAGTVVRGQAIEVVHVAGEGPRILVVGCIHGDECEGLEVHGCSLRSRSEGGSLDPPPAEP